VTSNLIDSFSIASPSPRMTNPGRGQGHAITSLERLKLQFGYMKC